MVTCTGKSGHHTEVPDISQVWFADDVSAVGSLSSLLTW